MKNRISYLARLLLKLTPWKRVVDPPLRQGNPNSSLTMPMKTLPHLGGFIRREIVEPLGLSVTEAASVLGVTRQALSNLLNERTGLSPDMALRIEKAFGPKMDHLMRMQLAFDLAEARRREAAIKVKRFVKRSAA